jgi:uncharacterized protein (TIGR02598 family)
MTLVEVLIAVVAIGIVMVTLYVAITQGFGVIQVARENLRAIQILQEKMETMRVYNWNQIQAKQAISPENFTEPFYAVGNNDNGGFTYSGRVWVAQAFPVSTTAYADDLRMVVVEVTWNSGAIQRRREMRTLVSRAGLHSYVY